MNRSRGFTLVELLVAIMVFSVLAAMAYGGLRSVLSSERTIDQSAQRLGEVQQAMLFVERDFAQLCDRGIRDEYGDKQPPLHIPSHALTMIEMTRDGWSNPAGRMRSTLQRVGYAIEEQQLVRYSWAVLDRAPDTTPQRFVLMSNVQSLSMRFMDEQRAWQEKWPVNSTVTASTNDSPPSLPRAVEFTIELGDLGAMRRVYMVDAAQVKAIKPVESQGGDVSSASDATTMPPATGLIHPSGFPHTGGIAK